MSGYDVIGDVHGEATKLDALLGHLGYEMGPGGYRHPQRQAVFVGDVIDRGDEQLRTLEIVRSMVESGSAKIIMGNHEFNAIAWATVHPDRPTGHLRPHSDKNLKQHRAFLTQLRPAAQTAYVEWFRTLPLWLDLGKLRVVHACWHDESIAVLDEALDDGRLSSPDLVVRAADGSLPDNHLSAAAEVILKGPELDLAAYGLPPFVDKDGITRHEARIRWWRRHDELLEDLMDLPAGATQPSGSPYPRVEGIVSSERERSFAYEGGIPVIYGHHWRQWTQRERAWTPYTACVDFSAASGGPLVAYRWSGEEFVDPRNLVAGPA